jgi:hypothetical protein
LNGAVSKTVVGLTVHRGFESLPLRLRARDPARGAGSRLFRVGEAEGQRGPFQVGRSGPPAAVHSPGIPPADGWPGGGGVRGGTIFSGARAFVPGCRWASIAGVERDCVGRLDRSPGGDASRSGHLGDVAPRAPGRRCGRGRALLGRVRATGPTLFISGAGAVSSRTARQGRAQRAAKRRP